ncbi:unnamed protein product [Kluyveromyces dobzhanskii CBS 2104]|uniref:WGS project CCBQ000000000 data, contig MAT n=1 Tax=Kluyveromyces dobzhanskii CBS 2104 TaxID=1427455 RepID=A0A0A8L1I5_9SACH|nr:unnamed protein product [Kluyveromyces dobzhanskii CBS 2104]
MSETISVTATTAPDVDALPEAVAVSVAETSPAIVGDNEKATEETANDKGDSSANESEEEKPKLVLAPLPTKSPWEETGVTDVKPLDLSKVVAAKNKKVSSQAKLRAKGTPSLTGKEKWVPLDVDIVVKDKIPEVGTVNGGKGKKLKSKAKKDKPKTTKKTKAKDATKPKKEVDSEKKAAKKQDRQSNRNSSLNGNGEKPSADDFSTGSAKTQSSEVGSNDLEERQEVASSTSNSNHPVANSSSAPTSSTDDESKKDNQQRRFTSNSKPFFPKSSSNHNRNNNGHGYHNQHHHNNNNGSHYHGSKSQRQRPYAPVVYQQNYTPSYVLVDEIVRQIQYYFSIENLSKDMFLKSQMNAQGFVPLALISRFHRMLNLSYGDVGLILAALRELKISEDSNVNIEKLTEPFENVLGNPLFQYAMSSKVWVADESIVEPKSYETVELVGDELELFKIEPLNPIIDSLPTFKPDNSVQRQEEPQDQKESSETQENSEQKVSVE